MLQRATPIIRVSNSVEAEAFYCGKLGFRAKSAYRPDPKKADPCFLALVRDDAHVHVSSFPGDGPFGVQIQIIVDDADALLQQLREAGVVPAAGPFDQTWGTREFSVQDPDGNKIIFAQVLLQILTE